MLPLTVSNTAIMNNSCRLKAKNALLQKLGREPSDVEVADYLKVPVEHVRLLERTFTNAFSIDGTVLNPKKTSDDDLLLVDGLFDKTINIEEEFIFDEVIEDIKNIMQLNLKERERFVLEYRYGFKDGEMHTLNEVGKCFGITREAVRQIESKAIRKIRIICDMNGRDSYIG